MIMSIAKLLLVGAHAEPEILTLLADTSIEKGKSLELFKEGFLTGIKNIEAEVVKKWKNGQGFSIRCPWDSTQYWTNVEDKTIKEKLQIKREVECLCCKEDMQRFLEGKSPVPNRWKPPFLR